jgi:hypothetical protein
MAKKTTASKTKAPRAIVKQKSVNTLVKKKNKVELVTLSGSASFAHICPAGIDSVVFKFRATYEGESYIYFSYIGTTINPARVCPNSIHSYGEALSDRLGQDDQLMDSIVTHLGHQLNIPDSYIAQADFYLLIEFSSTGNINYIRLIEPEVQISVTLPDTHNVPNTTIDLNGFYEVKTKIKNTVSLFTIKL